MALCDNSEMPYNLGYSEWAKVYSDCVDFNKTIAVTILNCKHLLYV